MSEGEDEQKECDRQMSESVWRLSVAFLFWANRKWMQAGNLHCQWQEGKEEMTPGFCPWKFAWIEMPLWSLFVWG